MRHRAALLTQVQQTNSHETVPAIGKNLAYTAHREGVAARFPAPAVQKSIAVDLARLGSYDGLLTALERCMVTTAKAHHAQVCSRLRSIPGGGNILALGLLYAMHDIHRCPRGQAFVSDGRLVTWAQDSAGKRYGTSGAKIGHAYLTWACSEAAVLCLRNKPAGQKSLARRATQQGTGKALTILAQKFGRAVYDLGQRDPACDLDKFLTQGWRGVGAPAAELGHEGISLATALCNDELTASANAYAHIRSVPGP